MGWTCFLFQSSESGFPAGMRNSLLIEKFQMFHNSAYILRWESQHGFRYAEVCGVAAPHLSSGSSVLKLVDFQFTFHFRKIPDILHSIMGGQPRALSATEPQAYYLLPHAAALNLLHSESLSKSYKPATRRKPPVAGQLFFQPDMA